MGDLGAEQMTKIQSVSECRLGGTAESRLQNAPQIGYPAHPDVIIFAPEPDIPQDSRFTKDSPLHLSLNLPSSASPLQRLPIFVVTINYALLLRVMGLTRGLQSALCLVCKHRVVSYSPCT